MFEIVIRNLGAGLLLVGAGFVVYLQNNPFTAAFFKASVWLFLGTTILEIIEDRVEDIIIEHKAPFNTFELRGWLQQKRGWFLAIQIILCAIGVCYLFYAVSLLSK